ncbi:MAG: homoserine dehydrogenase [Clostridium perfringens]|nr:homoserine dehydrogenase [Clostridium perfringens]
MKKVNIALLGFGNVGMGVYRVLDTNKEDIARRCGYEINIKRVLVKNLSKERAIKVQEGILTDNFCEILNDDSIDIVVEVMGGEFPTLEYILEAMKRKKHIVTANKLCMAKHRELLLKTSQEEKVFLYYEASVCGGMPIIKQINESLVSNKIEKIVGIVNGTTNYILTKMDEENMSFENALKLAQEEGFAEADPTNDIEGFDSVYKLSIMSSLCFGTTVNSDDILRQGIVRVEKEDIEYAKKLGYSIKLLATSALKDGKIEARVEPCLVPKNHSFSTVKDALNAVSIKGNVVGEVVSYGQGAGPLPTGSAVVSDILSIIRCDLKYENLNHDKELKNNFSILSKDDIESEFYIKFKLNDKEINNREVIVDSVNKAFYKNNIKLSSITKDNENLIILTKKCKENLIRNAIEEIKESVEGNLNVKTIRIENFK